MSNLIIPSKNRLGGYFIFEGVDGCGKTSCINKVQAKFKDLKIPCTLIKEPGGTPTGDYLRNLIHQGPLDVFPLQHLFLASRYELFTKLYQGSGDGGFGFYSLEGEEIPVAVLSDRGFPSTFVFQSNPHIYHNELAREKDWEKMWEIHEKNLFSLAFPQAVLYLEVSPSTALSRCEDRAAAGEPLQSFDTLDFYIISQRIFLYEEVLSFLASKGVEVIRIPANGPPDEVADQAFEALQFLFQPRNFY